MKDVNFPHPKKVDLFKVKKQLPVPKPPQKQIPLSPPKSLPKLKSKSKPRTFEELRLERKLAKAGFRGFY